jgi:hypothetical protein
MLAPLRPLHEFAFDNGRFFSRLTTGNPIVLFENSGSLAGAEHLLNE